MFMPLATAPGSVAVDCAFYFKKLFQVIPEDIYKIVKQK